MAENQSASEPGEQVALETENSIETYRTIAEWIRFADAKAGVTLTVNGVLMGLLIPTLRAYLTDKSIPRPFEGWNALVVFLFLSWMFFVVISAFYSFLCILPLRGLGRQIALDQTTHFHPAAISQRYPLAEFDRFVADCEKMGAAGLKREIHAAILIDAHLSSAKYRYVTRSIWCLAISVVLGFLYLLAIQL